ncbi:MAG: pyridoxamine 5'-phosphate oxidase family protein [bacterium]
MDNVKLPPALASALSEERTPKFLATLDAGGVPNVVPVISIRPGRGDELIFAELMIWKTKKNLLENARVCVVAVSRDLTWWEIRGDFLGFETKGDYFEELSRLDMFRYNAYSGIRSAGVIRAVGVSAPEKVFRPALIPGLAASKLRSAARGGGPHAMPRPVAEKFNRFRAAKAIAVRGGDGYPAASLASTMFPAGRSRLVMAADELPSPARNSAKPCNAAASVITFDPVAYQVKGLLRRATYPGGLRMAVMNVEETYSASPPLPGKRLA